MTRLSLTERLRITGLGLDRARRATVSRVLASPAVRWSFGPQSADQLLIVPQDLRTADPSFWRELKLGQLGLAGSTADLGGRSPFDVRPPSDGWARALYGFGWLRHLDAVENPEAREMARSLAIDWARHRRATRTSRFDAAVRGRRMISWLSHANLLLEGADQRSFDVIADSLGAQTNNLAATWRDVPTDSSNDRHPAQAAPAYSSGGAAPTSATITVWPRSRRAYPLSGAERGSGLLVSS